MLHKLCNCLESGIRHSFIRSRCIRNSKSIHAGWCSQPCRTGQRRTFHCWWSLGSSQWRSLPNPFACPRCTRSLSRHCIARTRYCRRRTWNRAGRPGTDRRRSSLCYTLHCPSPPRCNNASSHRFNFFRCRVCIVAFRHRKGRSSLPQKRQRRTRVRQQCFGVVCSFVVWFLVWVFFFYLWLY